MAEKLRTVHSAIEAFEPTIDYLEALTEENSGRILRSLGERAVVKTAFEALATTEEAIATNNMARRIMSDPTTYTMPEGDPK